MLHVAQLSFFTDPSGRAPEELLSAWPSLVDVAEAARGAGVRVTVIQACPQSHDLTQAGVSYNFLPFGSGVATVDTGRTLGELLHKLAPDVLHVHGLSSVRDIWSLAALAPGIPILLQDHADRPPRPWRRRAWRRGLSVASGLAFCAHEQARPFADAGLIGMHTQVYEIPESSSRFVTGDQTEARRVTGLKGDPCLLWVGHLDRNKDPLVVLDGVSEAVQQLPDLQLWCCFATAPLLPAVERKIDSDPRLRGRVHLLGRVAHERIEQLMQAADIFVLGSHREGSGYSLIEALACGLPPVVTDIPSFRSLTGSATPGALWPCGDMRKFAAALASVAAMPRVQARAAARAHFEQSLSFAAVGRKLAAAYRDLVERSARRSATKTIHPPISRG